MIKRIIVIVSFAGLLAGCAFSGTNPAPTAYPADFLPTVIYQTAQSINATLAAQTESAATETETPTLTPSPIPPTPTPTKTPTPAPGVPLGAIRISAPGPMSKVISPLQINMTVVTGSSNKAQVDLYGEDGRLLARQVLFVRSLGSGEYVFLKIPFQIRAAAEVGILQISTKDASGLLVALNTVRVLLLSSGASQINPAGNAIYERIALENLPPQSAISGGVLTVKGTYLPYNRQPLILELIGSDGKSLMVRVLTVDGLTSQAFNTTLPYKVGNSTPADLIIRQKDDVLNGPVYLYSQGLTLNP